MTESQDKRLFGARSLPSRGARRVALRVGDRSGLLERALIPDLAQVRLRYKDSPLSVGGGVLRGGQYAPGRQVPEVAFVAADGSGPVALRDSGADGTIALVAVPGRGSQSGLTDLETLIREYPGSLRFRQAVGPLSGDADGRPGSLIAVRPDGYIGYRGPCAVTPALRRWIGEAIGTPDSRERVLDRREAKA
jgi:hypothetical protein